MALVKQYGKTAALCYEAGYDGGQVASFDQPFCSIQYMAHRLDVWERRPTIYAPTPVSRNETCMK
ncbi:hypothetical protein PV04_08945 [Phialophora macrospora]|uniref:Uncharacterized protein n=1 Tax=Phialophora macrospora TaxID=1851006 RepID=A0A0D2FAX5_9EURO|nr:hypothetical protein PV04_08945 [Phialophora macrospora]